ncbi:MAG: hypothetical protein SFV22_20370 [Saprospiraceae bacterium]|nr:hypothetical protein [Saprospiraceae bacterium]
MPTQTPSIANHTATAVVRTLAYFAVFSHPLTKEEVHVFCGEKEVAIEEITEILEKLKKKGQVFQFYAYYQLKNDPAWVQRRMENNRRADSFLKPARRMARLIGQFPYVRGVFVSGSLSKHCMRPDSDVDFFIVTEPGRLWLARTLLVLFKKVFLLNSRRYFCVNYFVDTRHLEIEEKNIFTATEVVTLLPFWGREYYEAFRAANRWASEFYPNHPPRNLSDVPPDQRGLLKRMFERLFAGSLGDRLDRRAMLFTVNYWRKKFHELDPDTFDLALKSRQGISKHHPLHFQEKVLRQFDINFRDRHG